MIRGASFAVYRGDPLLLMLGAVLVSIGLIAIASASIEYSDFHFNNPGITLSGTRCIYSPV